MLIVPEIFEQQVYTSKCERLSF